MRLVTSLSGRVIAKLAPQLALFPQEVASPQNICANEKVAVRLSGNPEGRLGRDARGLGAPTTRIKQ